MISSLILLDSLENCSFTKVMALRVLLADESTTIKKVMQLALQDYGVEVKSIPVGLDVLPVALSFQPDIIFVDVLLQKKSGYDVARDLKLSKELKPTPVVLMWSGFMELDEAKAKESQVDRRLEKPFDAETLRTIVRDLVVRSKENVVAEYLTFPKLPEFTEEPRSHQSPAAPTSPSPSMPISMTEMPMEESSPMSTMAPESIYDIPEVDENEELGNEGWAHQDLSNMKSSTPPLATPVMSMSSPKNSSPSTGQGEFDKYIIPNEDLSAPQIQSSGEFEEVTFNRPSTPSASPAQMEVPSMNFGKSTASAMDHVVAEKILREEAQVLIEKVLWQVLPGICERVVKEELNKLLKDVEQNI